MAQIFHHNVVGKAIKRGRKLKKLTQEQVAAKLQLAGFDVSRESLSKVETGRRGVSVAELRFLKELLNLEYEDFFEPPEDKDSQ